MLGKFLAKTQSKKRKDRKEKLGGAATKKTYAASSPIKYARGDSERSGSGRICDTETVRFGILRRGPHWLSLLGIGLGE